MTIPRFTIKRFAQSPLIFLLTLLLTPPSLGETAITVRTQMIGAEVENQSLTFQSTVERTGPEQFQVRLDDTSWQLIQSLPKGSELKITIPLNTPLVIRKPLNQKVISFATSRQAVDGLTVQLSLQGIPIPTLTLPISSIVSPDGDDTFIYVVKNSRAVKTPVSIWRVSQRGVEILQPHKQVRKIITGGAHKVVDGDLIKEL